MKQGEEKDSPGGIDREIRSTDRMMMVALIMVALGGIVVTLVSALVGVLS